MSRSLHVNDHGLRCASFQCYPLLAQHLPQLALALHARQTQLLANYELMVLGSLARWLDQEYCSLVAGKVQHVDL